MRDIKRILVPTDFSPTSDEALGAAVSLAQKLGAELTLHHVYQIPSYAFPDGVVIASPDVLTELLSSVKRHMDQLVAKLASDGVRVLHATDEGSAWMEIVRRATDESFDLIIMGTHGRSGFSHLLLGSVAEKVIRKAPCPVMTVPRPASPSQ